MFLQRERKRERGGDRDAREQHFLDYDFVSKDPVWVRDRARVLGLQKDGIFQWKWGIDPSAHIFTLQETNWLLPRMWMAPGGSCIYQAPSNCSNEGLEWQNQKRVSLSNIDRNFEQSTRSGSWIPLEETGKWTVKELQSEWMQVAQPQE